MNRRQYLILRFYLKQLFTLVILSLCIYIASNKQIQVNNLIKTYRAKFQIEGRCNWPSDDWKTERVTIYEFPSLPKNKGDITRYYIYQNKKIIPLFSNMTYTPSSYLMNNYDSVLKEKCDKHEYLLVLAVSEESYSLKEKTEITLLSLGFFQKSFNVRVVYFTASQSIIQKCEQLGIDVVTQYITNYKGLPIVREMYTVSRSLYQAQYYGYLNSDILLSPSLIPVLEKLSQSYQQGELTDGFFVSGVAFDISNGNSITFENVKQYAQSILKTENKLKFRERCSSDFWIFHHTMDFTLLDDVVIGREKVDTYIMSLLYTLKHSVVDATYSIISLHQGTDGFAQRTAQIREDTIDSMFNDFIFYSYGMEKTCMSIPGDKVIFWEKGKLVLTDWNRDVPKREAQRQRLIDEIRSTTTQIPKEWM